MRAHIALTSLAALMFMGSSAPADDVTTTTIPDQFVVSRGPARSAAMHETAQSVKVEHTADASAAPNTPPLDGSFYAEIFPLFNGDGGNSSFIRLGTTSATSSTFDLTVLGEPSGTLYGYGQITVPPYSSPQESMSTILTATGTPALSGNDTSYALYLDNQDPNSYYQHVIFNGGNQFFEDMTICPMGASQQSATTINNIHTTLLSAFPSTVYIHNYLDVTADYKVVMRDSATGQQLGTIADVQVTANSTYAVPESWFEQQINFTPGPNNQHATLVFSATPAFATLLGVGPNPTDLGAIFGMSVLNNQFNAVLNLSNKCIINR